MIAEADGKCDGCHGDILTGEELFQMPDGWGHRRCADFAWDQYWGRWDRMKRA